MNAFWVKDKYDQFRDILVGFDNLVRSVLLFSFSRF